MQVKLGMMYQTRSNQTITFISKTAHPTHPWVGLDIKGKIHMYTSDGFYIENGFPHKLDVVSE